MNCHQCQEQLTDYLEGLLEPSAREQIEAHLAFCSDCQAEREAVGQLVDCLTCDGQTSADVSLDIPVMGRIIREQSIQLRRFQMQRRIRWIQVGGGIAAAIAVLAVIGTWQARPDQTVKAAELRLCAAEVMAKGAEAASEVKSIHIRARMRTSPKGNLGDIDAKCEFVPVELWREFANVGRWRIEKPGRVIVMDGDTQTVFIKPDYAARFGKPSPEYLERHWLHRVAAVQETIGDELRMALTKGWDLTLTHDKDKKGRDKATVVIEVRSGLKDGDWVKNKVIEESDTRRVYHFDGDSGRLEGLEIYLHGKGGDVLIFEITGIEYNQPIDPKLFELELPENVIFREEPQKLADNEKYAGMTPQEAAHGFFQACAQEDWDELRKFMTSRPSESFKEDLGGLTIVAIGEPFQSKGYAGWYVPYEIKFKSGRVQKHNLALRNDNPAKRYVVDGGI